MAQQTEASKNRTDALAIVAAAAASLFVTISGYIVAEHGKRLDSKDRRITALEIGAAAAREHISDQDASLVRRYALIEELQRSERQIQIRLDRLETKPSARPDPFTGSDGKRLEEMIANLRKRISAQAQDAGD